MARNFTPEEAAAAREAKLEAFQARVEAAVAELVTGDDWIRAVAFAARFRQYSFQNTLSIYAQHQLAYARGLTPDPEPGYVAGYKEWERLGRYAIAGRGYGIIGPRKARFASTDPAGGEWRRLAKGEQPRTGEFVTLRMVGVTPVTVWEGSQTTGETPIPVRATPKLLEGEAPAGLWDGLAARVAAAGYQLDDVENAAAIRGANGMTHFGDRTVQVRLDMDDAARVKTLAHELGHVLLTAPSNPDASHHRGISEVEAESFAAMVCACYGMDSTGYTVPYVAVWSETVKDKTPLEVMRATGDRVREAVLAELDHLPAPTVDGGTPPAPESELEPEQPERSIPTIGPSASKAPVREAVGR